MKKGFTLIELLAVIVILAIIATIAAPIVLNVIDDSKESSTLSSADNYMHAVEIALSKQKLKSNNEFNPSICTISLDKLTCDGILMKVDVSGGLPFSGTVIVENFKIKKIELMYENNKTVVLNSNNKLVLSSDVVEAPNLYDDTLTPVVYNGENWVVANTNKSWYNYDNQEWANAVILKNNVSKKVGDIVTVEGTNPDALAMYVWIPRFEYKIEGAYGKDGIAAKTPGEIEINFISLLDPNPSTGYRVHPAFTFGDVELSGIWVGKFEISHTSYSDKSNNCVDENCSNADGLRILPNVKALRQNNVSSFFYSIRSMERENNPFGLDGNLVDSHMAKNTEWAAVAYLSQSKYGKYGNVNYKYNGKTVYMNNSSEYYTGRSGGTPAGNIAVSAYGKYTYDGYLLNSNTKTTTREEKSVASTTGNITGVYDMSGGSNEFVMVSLVSPNGEKYSGYNSSQNSGFTGKLGYDQTYYNGIEFPEEKYFDVYTETGTTATAMDTACNGGICYGHGLTETRYWYSSGVNSSKPLGPWYVRGGVSSSESGTNKKSGTFYIAVVRGNASTTVSTRAVLVSEKDNTVKKENLKIYNDGEVVYFDVEKGSVCSVEQYNPQNSNTGYNGIDNKNENQNSCLKFYAFNDTGGYTLKLILDHNTTATSMWNSSGRFWDGPKEVLIALKNDTKDWKGTSALSNYTTGPEGKKYTADYSGYTARIISTNEIAQITKYIGYDENVTATNETFHLDSNKFVESSTCTIGNTTGCKYGWLYDRTNVNCLENGCLNNSDIGTAGYWTISSSPRISDAEGHQICDGRVIYGISHRARVGRTCPNQENHYGVRPVIEVSKKLLSSN